MICTQPLLYIIELRFYIRVIFDAYVRGLVYKCISPLLVVGST